MKDVYEIFAESLKIPENADQVFDRFIPGRTTRKYICVACGGTGIGWGQGECRLCRGEGVVRE